MKKRLYLQQFAEENLTVAADLEPAISVDFTSRLSEGIKTLMKVLGISDMLPMAVGTTIKAYKMTKVNSPEQVGEGETIPLTKIERKLAWTKELGLKKYRKATGAETIQKVGYDRAVNETDEKLVKEVQKEIKADFFTALATGTGTASGNGLQAVCANLWAKLQVRYEDMEVTPVFFINPQDVADYLGKAQITMQTAFGLSYVENFLGMGTAIVTPAVKALEVWATVTENLNGAYVPASGDLANAFGLTMDETGLVGMTHSKATGNATLETLIMSCVLFYPEFVDGVFKGTIAA